MSALPCSSSASTFGPYAATPAAWVATAPTPAFAQGTTEPTARNFDCVATPHWPASRSQAQIEYVATSGDVASCKLQVASSAIGQLREVEVEDKAVKPAATKSTRSKKD